MITQKQAVVNAVTKIMGKEFIPGTTNCRSYFEAHPDKKEVLVAMVLTSFTSGECALKSPQENLKNYVVSMISNHFKKGSELNGGQKYIPSKTGERVGHSNPEIKAIRQLLGTLEEGTPKYALAKKELDARVDAIKDQRAKSKIDIDSLPANLRELVG